MKITIDTKEDSHDDLRRVISMLQTMINHQQPSNIYEPSSSNQIRPKNIFDDPSPSLDQSQPSNIFEDSSPSTTPEPNSSPAVETNAFANMFGDSSPPPSQDTADDEDIDLGQVPKFNEDEEKEEDIPEVIEY